MVKIGIDGRTFSVPNPGGAVRTGIELTKELNNLHSDLEIFSNSNAASRLNGISVDSYAYNRNSKILGMLWEQFALPKRATDLEVDILYSPVAYCPLVPTSFLCAITIHDLSSFHGHSAGWYNQFERIVVPKMASRADIIFTVSKFSKSRICSELDIPESKVHVIYNGVNEQFFSNSHSDSNLDLPDSYLLYVGALSTRKNISGLLKAFRILKENYGIEHELVLIGPEDDPTNESDISSEIIDPIRENIVQLGYIPDDDLKVVYDFADVFVFPSFYEGFGMPPLEAMACGTPVVASDRTAIPEVLGDGAEYVNPDSPESIAKGVNNILTNTELKRSLIKKGHNRAAKFQWNKSAKNLREVLCGAKITQNNSPDNTGDY